MSPNLFALMLNSINMMTTTREIEMPLKRTKNPHSFISKRDATRAVYIDFEGYQKKSPTLLGILIGGNFEQVVFDQSLHEPSKNKGLRITELNKEIARLIELCKKENRFLVAYSQHEINVIKEYTGLDVSALYKDARMIAKKWKNTCYRQSKEKCRALKDYLAFIGYERGSHLGERKSTARIRAVQAMAALRGDYDDFTPVVKAKWTKLLDHNEIDCRGMKALVERASDELEKGQRS